MATEGKTSISRIGASDYLLLPYVLKLDSKYPFNKNSVLVMKIQNKKIIVEEEEQNETGTN
jgi:hypothetical protein